jgi:DNA-binding CsgD family transcriptional regulator
VNASRLRIGYHRSGGDGFALTALERAVLEAYAAGADRLEIAQRVGLAPRTVGTYLTIAKEKLGARTLAHAATIAVAARG